MGKIENALVIGVAVDRAHEPVRDFELVVQHFGQGRETVGGAARIGNNRVFCRVVDAVVNSDANRRVRILRRRTDQYPFCAGLADMQLGLVARREKAGRFRDNFDA